MEASEPKWVNPVLNTGGLHIIYTKKQKIPIQISLENRFIVETNNFEMIGWIFFDINCKQEME